MSNDVWTDERIISALKYLNIPSTQEYFDAIEEIADAVLANDGEAATKVAIKIAQALKEEDPADGTNTFSLTALDRSRPIDRIARAIVGNVRNWHRMYTRNRNWTTNFAAEGGTGEAPTDGDGGTPAADQDEGIDFNGLVPGADRQSGGSSSDSYEYYTASGSSSGSGNGGGGNGGGGGGGDGGGSSSSEDSGDTKSFGDFFQDPLDSFREDTTADATADAPTNAQQDGESEYRSGPRRSDVEEGLELQSAHGRTRSSRPEREREAADRAAALSRNDAFFAELVRRAELDAHPELHSELRATFDDVVENRVGSALGRIEGLARRVAEVNTGLQEGVNINERIEELQAQIAHSAVRAAERLVRGVDPAVPDEDDHTHPAAIAAAENNAKKAEADAEDVLLRAAKVRAAEMAEAGTIPDGVAIEEVVDAFLEEGRRARQAWTQKLTALPEHIARNSRFRAMAEQAAEAAVDRNERAARWAYTEAIDIARRLVPEGMPATAITEGMVSSVLGEAVVARRAELARLEAEQAEQADETPDEAMSVATMDRIEAEKREDEQPADDAPARPDRDTMDRIAGQNALMNLSAADLLQRISAAIDVPDMTEALRLAGALAMLRDEEKGKFAGKSAREIVAMVIKTKQAKRKRSSETRSDAPGRDPRPPSGGTPPAAGAAGGAGTGTERPAGGTDTESADDEPTYQAAADAGVELTRALLKQVDWDNFCEIYAIRLTDRTALLDTALAMVKKGADSAASLNAAKVLVTACKSSGGVKVKNAKHMRAAVEHAMVSRAGGKRKLAKPLKASAVGEEEAV